MSWATPVVSIGMPVYNGGNYLSVVLDSILAQRFSDFELIISDNASTDGTEELCRNYRARDSRIRYYRNSRNLGAAKNHNRVFELATGKYFKWAMHDDELSPEFLARCVPVLERDPSVVLCHSRILLIDEFNRRMVPLHAAPASDASTSTSERFGGIVAHDRLCADLYGVIRSDALRKTSLIAPYVGSDRILRAELALLGRFFEVPAYLFLLRDHAERSVRSMPAHHQRVEWFDPDQTNRRVFPHWRMLLEYWKTIQRAPLMYGERFRCRLHLAGWIIQDSNWARMAADLLIAVHPGSWRFLYELASQREKDLVPLTGRVAGPAQGSRRNAHAFQTGGTTAESCQYQAGQQTGRDI